MPRAIARKRFRSYLRKFEPPKNVDAAASRSDTNAPTTVDTLKGFAISAFTIWNLARSGAFCHRFTAREPSRNAAPSRGNNVSAAAFRAPVTCKFATEDGSIISNRIHSATPS